MTAFADERLACPGDLHNARIFSWHEFTMLFRLIYISRARDDVDLDALMQQAREGNHATDITGGLALIEHCFFQYLEGPEDAVERLFARIERDPRHSEIRVVERRAVPRRMFEAWSMALMKWNAEMKEIFYSFSPGAAPDLYAMDPTTAAPLFRAWSALLKDSVSPRRWPLE